jgi:tRNA wybutosine-synthesizing protein 1
MDHIHPTMSESDDPKQVDSPVYHHENHTAAQTCGWTTNAYMSRGNDLSVHPH